MSTHTYILGKDAALEDSINSMQKRLEALDLHIIEQSWLNPVANVWSVHIHERDCPLLFTNGKGTSRKAALASALGEFFERLSTHYFWADYYLGDEVSKNQYVHYPNEKWFIPEDEDKWPVGLLDQGESNELREFYNPTGELDIRSLIDINSSNTERGICALPYVCHRTKETVYFPVNIVSNLYVRNGMSAGNTVNEARVQCLSEILERHVKFNVIADGTCLPDVPLSVLEKYPGILAGIEELESAGYPLLVKDASLSGKYPVMCMILINPKNKGCYASFGAHPRFEIALERALTGLLQGRGLDALGDFSEPGFDLDEIASPQNLETHFIDSSGIISWEFLREEPDYEFFPWGETISSTLTTTEEEFNWLCKYLHDDGNDIYIADYDQFDIYACRILVPGLSEIYLPEDLIWDNNNAGISLRNAILNENRTPMECRELIEKLENLTLNDQFPVAALIGLPADKDSIWSELRVAELITLLALKSGDKDRISEGCQWMLHSKQINPQRLEVYRCIDILLQLEETEKPLTEYVRSLAKLYGQDSVDKALILMGGDDVFTLGSDWKMHGLLLEAYKKIRSS